MSPAREVAFDVLRAVEQGGFASELLLARCATLESRDAGLACEIVFGVLRRQAQLDWLIRQTAGREVGRLDPEVRIALRLGLYQLRHLDRVPAHAAVGESVELVKRARKRSAAGLVNAVLRKAARGGGGAGENSLVESWPDRATALSMPAWLVEGWTAQFGRETAEGIASAFLAAPQTYIRVPAGSVEPPPPGAEPTEVAGCYRVSGLEAAGAYRCQDIGSQAVVPLLALAPGLKFLDLCAAPGNKTAQALETAGVSAVACDRNLRRARGLAGSLRSSVVVADGRAGLPFRTGCFDRILVDAPCSGTGTLGRNPEIRWRIQAADLEALHARQVALLANALAELAPAGRLVYSTCSLERRENEDVVAAALARAPEFRIVARMRRIPGRDAGDGFFAVALERRGGARSYGEDYGSKPIL